MDGTRRSGTPNTVLRQKFDQVEQQSPLVSGKERKFPTERRTFRVTNAKCKISTGEPKLLTKNQKPTDSAEKETIDKYLHDSYKQSFQNHVDNLTNVISQHTGRLVDQQKPKVRNDPITPLSRLEIKTDTGLNQVVTFGEEEDEDEPPMGRMNPPGGGVSYLSEKHQEENFFEELSEPNPMITFNHVSSEETSNTLGFHLIKSNSRSPSPMLEVPDPKTREKITTRPPL
ncbi:hypothetical protein RUM44_003102 [Polyplax serrata]|uniref:Uncharacterized protein n=1 Tax=Polyplax serrata TaxID=468196 RepID=A0ABR1AXJ6_POLSC